MDIREIKENGKIVSWCGLALGAVMAAAFSANAAEATVAPVRVSRAFFEKTLETEVKVNARAVAEPAEYATTSAWIEYPTDLPAPAPTAETGPVLADFRDFKACNELESPNGLKLCFKVMPDVSSVGLNAREMAIEGLDAVLPVNCTAGKAQLTGATRDDDTFTVTFALDQPGCEGQIELKVRSL